MKVVQILYPGLGGTSNVAFSIVEGQKYIKKKFSNFFIFNGNENLLKQNQIKCEKKRINFSYKKLSFPFSTTLEIIKKLKEINPEIIINHSNSVFPTFIFKYFFKTKVLYVDHTPDKTRGYIDWLKSFFSWLMSDGVVFVSQKKKNSFILKIMTLFKIKYRVILNATNLDDYKKKDSNNYIFKVGMAARFVDDKLQKILLEIFDDDINFFKKNKIFLTLAGDGPNYLKYKNEYKKNPQIKLVGNLNEKKLKKWFETLSCYAHISKDETTSTSVLQSMAAGVPLVLSKVDGNISLLSVLGITKLSKLVSNDKLKIKKAIISVYLNKKKFIKNSEIIKKKIKDKIDIKNFTNKYLNMIKDI